MAVFISFLRGINVGGNRKIKMTELKTLYESLGFTHVQTLLQSGNVVFKTDQTDPIELARQIEDGIQKTFGFHSQIVLRTADQLRAVIKAHTFSEEQLAEPSRILVMFLLETPASDAVDLFKTEYKGPEPYSFNGQEMYIHYGSGMADSKLSNALIDKRLKTISTGRNWNTVTKLLAMAEALEES
jgi:uncharacterized protein (DUF1697 family)